MKEGIRRARGATIVDVAAHVGVSPMTVSRVINGHPGVRPETRVAVEDAIRVLGYTPNVAARSLVKSAELRIGVVYSNPSAAFMSEFLTGVFEEASARGVRLIATDLDWARGQGPEARGKAEAVLMALAGRRGVVCIAGSFFLAAELRRGG